jgi:hypothetical protein
MGGHGVALQECPTLVVTGLMYRGANPACMARPANRALVAMYLVHYVHRYVGVCCWPR